jgi:hypothetical protein
VLANVEGWGRASGRLLHAGSNVHRSDDDIVNASVAIDPEKLAGLVHQSVKIEGSLINSVFRISMLQSFRPGCPVPAHRFSDE